MELENEFAINIIISAIIIIVNKCIAYFDVRTKATEEKKLKKKTVEKLKMRTWENGKNGKKGREIERNRLSRND